jgi:predicted ester cyclase
VGSKEKTMNNEKQQIVEQNKAIIRRLYDEVLVTWNMAVVDDLLAADYVGHELPPGTPPGPKSFHDLYAQLRAGFPDVKYSVEDLIAEGDKVVVRWSWQATHTGEFLGVAPTDRATSMLGIAIYHIAGRKIKERWVELDLLGLQQRLSV